MGIVTDWVRNLILMTAGISFVEILLPRGAMGKYLRFVLALVLLAVLVYPLTDWGNLETTAFTDHSYTSEGRLLTPDPAEARMEEIRTKQISQVYREKLAAYIKEIAEGEFPGIEVLGADIYISSSDRKYEIPAEEIRVNTRGLLDKNKLREFLSQRLEIPKGKITVENRNEEGT